MNSPSRIWIDQWMTVHSFLIIIGLITTILTNSVGLLLVISVFSFANFYYRYYQQQGSVSFAFEAANLVSSARLLLLFFLLAFFPFLDFRQISILALLILASDGLDGYLARRFNTVSEFGAYLDMETDAFYVLTMSYLIYSLDLLGIWVLTLGLIRYVYYLLIRFLKPPEQKERRSFIAQFIAVFMMGSLISCFVLPPDSYQPIVILASVLLAYSFGRDFLFIFRYGTEKN